jgi:biotin operon repressor
VSPWSRSPSTERSECQESPPELVRQRRKRRCAVGRRTEHHHNGHGFTQILNLVLRLPGLSSDAKLVYMGLQRGSCYPGQQRLADDLGLSRHTIMRRVSELERAGLLEIQRRAVGQTNLYVFKSLSQLASM